MKEECEIRVMLANEEADLKNVALDLSKGNTHRLMDNSYRQGRIDVMAEILETKDNQCY